MADLAYLSTFTDITPDSLATGVVAQPRSGLGIATVMLRNGQLPALTRVVEQHFRIRLPAGPQAATAGAVSFLGTGPGRWLVVQEAAAPEFVAQLAGLLDGLASVVDQSSAYGVVEISGPLLPETLARGVAVDISSDALPPGRVVITQIAHIGTTLWKRDEAPTFLIFVARSMANSFRHWLETSAQSASASRAR